ncbi:MAG: radical SAM protein, partial [Deltaproteobacteria bacterium]|nr:radical SAM protein [Deltaproteobacteria bacterium]
MSTTEIGESTAAHPATGPEDFGFQWHLTDRCNLRCAHCYQERFDPQGERPLAELKEMADRICAAIPGRPLQVNLTGGEPLLHPHLAELVEHLHLFPGLDEVHLITNGTVAPERLLRRLGDLPRLRWLKVSLESGDAAVNDAIRGPGNLAQVTRIIPLLRQRCGREVILMVTLARYNVSTIRSTVALGRRIGAAGIIFERFVPLGRGRALAAQVLCPVDWLAAQEAILQVAGLDDVDPAELHPFRAFWLWLGEEHEEPLQGALCNLGGGSMALMPDGTIHPCRRLPVPLGNVLAEPFPALLERLARHDAKADAPAGAGCRALARALG